MLKVSVLILAYNKADYIEQAINSVLAQKVHFDYEIVIAEDCSTDNTKAIIQEKYAGIPNIKTIYNKENLGIRKNYISAISVLQGQYYTVLDPDDYWIGEHKLQQQVDWLDNHVDFVAVAHNTVLEHADGTEEIMIKDAPDKDVYTMEDIASGACYFHTSSIMYRNIYINRPVPSFFEHKFGGDVCRMLYNAQFGKVKYIHETSSYYRMHGSGVWSSMDSTTQLQNNVDAILFYKKWMSSKYDEYFCSWYVATSSAFLKESIDYKLKRKYTFLCSYFRRKLHYYSGKKETKKRLKNILENLFYLIKPIGKCIYASFTNILCKIIVNVLFYFDTIKYYRKRNLNTTNKK